MRIAYRLIAAIVALGLVTPSAPALARGPEDVETLYAEGDASFANGDYVGAARAWGKALDLMEETEDTNSTRAQILVSALSAYMEAFVETRKVEHLRAAARLLEEYAQSLETAYDGNARLSEAVIEMKRRLDNALASAESEPTSQPTQPDPGPTGPTTSQPVDSDDQQRSQPPTATGRGFIIAGVALTAASLGTASLTIIGLVQGMNYDKEIKQASSDAEAKKIEENGTRANNMAIAGGVTTPILLGAGIAMLIVGSRRSKASVAALPLLRPGFAGIGISGRF